MKSLKLVPLVAAMTALGVAGNAQADAYAIAYNNVTNLLIGSTFDADGDGMEDDGIVPLSAFNSFTTHSESAAALLPNPPNASTSADGFGAIDASATTDPNSTAGQTRVNNAFNQFGQVGEYANSDTWIPTTQLLDSNGATAGGVVLSGSPFTQAVAIAESYITGNQTASSSGNNESTTGFSFDVSLAIGQTATFNFSFLADPYIMIDLGLPSAGGTATGVIETIFTITDASTGAAVFEWKPNGAVDANILGGTEIADGANINTQRSTNVVPNSITHDPTGDASIGTDAAGSGALPVAATTYASFSADTASLTGGNYNFKLSQTVRTNVVHAVAVPEPASIALMGLGLAGIGFSARRKRLADKKA